MAAGWQEWTDQAIRDDTGQLIEFQSVGRDITARKLAEESLLNELAFDELMTSMLTSFAVSSYEEMDDAIIASLQKIAEFFGGEFADILLLSEDGKTWKPAHHWQSPLQASTLHPTQTIRAGKLVWSENKLLRGEPIRINTLDDYPSEAAPDREFGEAEGVKSLLSVPITGKERTVYGVLDITAYNRQVTWSDSDVIHIQLIGDTIANLLERKRAEDALRKSEERFSKAFQSSPLIVLIAQISNARLLEVNETFEKISGYKREEVIGKTTIELVHRLD
jgi:PAS domain-containing protein